MGFWSAASVVLAGFWLILDWVWERVRPCRMKSDASLHSHCEAGAGGSSAKTGMHPITGFNALRIIRKREYAKLLPQSLRLDT